MESEETLRWPTNLDRSAIEQRVIQARATAEKHQLRCRDRQERDGRLRLAAAAALNLKHLK